MRTLKTILTLLLVLAVGAAALIGYFWRDTEQVIAAHRARVQVVAEAASPPTFDPAAIAALPEPVQRYFAYVFPEPPQPAAFVIMAMEGDFRRPLTEDFEPTTAEQITAIGAPALTFSGTTTIPPGLWVRVYDAFAAGEMEMKAMVLSTLTVVDEKETPALNQISLRRWLLESPLYPQALLPGGPVRWEPVDATRARAVVSALGMEASLVASFGPDGALTRFDAEEDGDLTTPYHGSGEHAARGDYQLVDGVRVPMSFTIARAAGGEIFPFWKGRITSFSFER